MSEIVICPACGGSVSFSGTSSMSCPYCDTTINPPASSSVSSSAATVVAGGGSDIDQIRKLAMNGKKIEAIARYRELTGVGLKEAKDAVEVLERGGSLADSLNALKPAAETSTEFASEAEMLSAVRSHMDAGRKIDAIKAYREYYPQSSLAEAKTAVESMEAGNAWAAPSTPPVNNATFGNSAEMMDEVKSLLRAKKKIEAIKVYRDYYPDMGLAEAKNAVEAVEAELAMQAPTPTPPPPPPPAFTPRTDSSPALAGQVIGDTPITTSTDAPAWQKWAIGCGIFAVLFCCFCIILPVIVSAIASGSGN